MSEPKRLGRYELLEQLGEGGMGSVWLARLTGTHGFEKLCIVKTVLPNIAKDKEFVSRFLHEGRVLTQLHHANIAQVYDMGEDAGTLFLALEYVPGVDLSSLHQQVRAKSESLPLSLAIYVAQQMAEGLGYAHRRTALDGKPLGIVHRDVSPQNVMVSYDGEVKVIDFGIARSEARSHRTEAASVMGKLGHMAPEQARGEPLDHRADQYAVGVVLWELLANAPYVPRGTLTEMVVAMAHPLMRPLTPLRPDVPPSLEATVLKVLAAEPDRRFPTCDDLARALMDELLRLGALPSKLQIGEYVRARCDEAFSKQQQLLTKIASVKTVPMRPEAPAAPPTERATPVGLESTLLRAGGEAPRPGPPVPTQPVGATPVPGGEPPLTTAQLQAATMKRSRAPLVALAAAVLLLGGAAVAWFVTRPGGPLALASAGAAGAGATGTAGTTGTAGATGTTGTAGTAGAGATGTAATDTAATDTAATDTGATDTGATDTGATGTDATGTDVTGTGAPPPGQGASDAPPPGQGAADAPPPPGQGGLNVPGPPAAAPPDAGPPPSPQGARPKPGSARLVGRARFTGAAYVVTNTSKLDWTGCTVTVPGRRSGPLDALAAGASATLPVAGFASDRKAAVLSSAVDVVCAEGLGRLPLR